MEKELTSQLIRSWGLSPIQYKGTSKVLDGYFLSIDNEVIHFKSELFKDNSDRHYVTEYVMQNMLKKRRQGERSLFFVFIKKDEETYDCIIYSITQRLDYWFSETTGIPYVNISTDRKSESYRPLYVTYLDISDRDKQLTGIKLNEDML